MYRSQILFRTGYVLVLSSLMSMSYANDKQSNPTLTEAAEQFLEAAKEKVGEVTDKAGQAVDWTAEQCADLKEKAGQAKEWTAEQYAQLKEKGGESVDSIKNKSSELKKKVGDVLHNLRAEENTVVGNENNPKPGRRTTEQVQNHETFDLEVPFEVKESVIGAEPVKRSRPIERGIDFEDVQMVPELTADQDSWVEWLTSDQAKLYGKGALALLTIGGITYVIFKNRIPQRITRAVTKTTLRTVITTACVLGLAAGVAHYKGVSLDGTLDGLQGLFVPFIP